MSRCSISSLYFETTRSFRGPTPEHEIQAEHEITRYVVSRRSTTSTTSRPVVLLALRSFVALRLFVVYLGMRSISQYLSRYLVIFDVVLRHVSKYLSEILRMLPYSKRILRSYFLSRDMSRGCEAKTINKDLAFLTSKMTFEGQNGDKKTDLFYVSFYFKYCS